MAFTRFTKNVLNVSALPDRVQNQAQTLKATFDQAGVDIKTALNALIAELEASTSADNIGADVQTVATKTVQAILTAFEEEIANRYTKTEAETLLATGTNDLVADIDVNLTTGVITVTKKDGTVETFDTAIEKVPSKFEFVESGDTYLLKITNVDGTTTQADVTKLMNIYNFNNSDYITFEVTGEGTQKTVTANIKANSIGLDKLSLSVVSTLEGYMNSAKDSATAAKTSETNARASELNALEAKSTAVNKAAEATASASAAKTSETNAEYWAKQAQAGGGGGGGITEIPIASADTLGGIKVGEGLEITEDGILSALANAGVPGGEGIKIVEIGDLEYENASGSAKQETKTINESIANYDFIMIDVYARRNGTLRQLEPVIQYVPELLKEGWGQVVHTTKSYKTDYYVALGLTFFEDLTVLIDALPGGYNSAFVGKVYGIKIDNPIILDGAVNVDTTPTEGSMNVVTSGGVKKYVDEHGVRVLEASTDNVIDFNTLTEPGVYLVKNCNDNTILNGVYSNTSTCYVFVNKRIAEDGTLLQIYQQVIANNAKTLYVRLYQASTGEWGEFDYRLPASYISAGTFAGQVKANATAASTLTKAQVRNITAQTTDLTAGTSILATGDIVLIYE